MVSGERQKRSFLLWILSGHGDIRYLVHPPEARSFRRAERPGRKARQGKGFLQSRPSLWNPILRNLLQMRALPITVREPGLRPCRAFAICVGNRGGGKPPPYEGRAEICIGRRERS